MDSRCSVVQSEAIFHMCLDVVCLLCLKTCSRNIRVWTIPLCRSNKITWAEYVVANRQEIQIANQTLFTRNKTKQRLSVNMKVFEGKVGYYFPFSEVGDSIHYIYINASCSGLFVTLVMSTNSALSCDRAPWKRGLDVP